MDLNKIQQLPEREMFPGFHGRFIHTGTMTLAYWRIEAGSVLPEHSHEHEQITQVISGRLDMDIGGETHVLTAGDVLTIEPHLPHGGKAIEEVIVYDIFMPEREDYK